MSCRFRVALCALALCLSLPTWARAQERCATVELTFDARTSEWRPTNPACDLHVELDANGRPEVFTRKNVPVSVVIINVNPLLFRARFGTVTLEAIPVSKDLQDLFTLAGALVKQVVLQHNLMSRDQLKAFVQPKPGASPSLEQRITATAEAIRQLDADRVQMIGHIQQLEFDDTAAVSIAGPRQPAADWTDMFEQLRTHLETGAGTAPAKMIDEARALLGNQAELMQLVAAMRHVAQLACELSQASADCQKEVTLLTRAFPVGRRITMPIIKRTSDWNKVATYPLTVAKDSPFADAISTTMPKEVTSALRLSSPGASLLGVSMGLVNSRVESPTWTAVADPANTSRKLVTQTKSERFSALPALIGSHAFSRANAKRPTHPVLEFGGSLDTKKPLWFVGLGISSHSILRLGAGWAWARVPALDGQVEGVTVVADDAAVKTREAWTGGFRGKGFYWSLGVSFSGFALFSK